MSSFLLRLWRGWRGGERGEGGGGENIRVSSPGQSRRYMGDELVEHRLTGTAMQKGRSRLRQTLFQELGREFPSLLDLGFHLRSPHESGNPPTGGGVDDMTEAG